MARMCIKSNIKVNLVDKDRLFKGKEDTFLDITAFIDPDDPNGEYGGTVGFYTQDSSKEERDRGLQMPILGNIKVTWRGDGGITAQDAVEAYNGQEKPTLGDKTPSDDQGDQIPF